MNSFNLHLRYLRLIFRPTNYIFLTEACNNPSTFVVIFLYVEGDYETSIEGMVSKKRSDAETYGAAPKESLRNPKKKSTFSIELAKLDRSDFPIENKFILELPREPSDELAWKVPRTYNLISSPASSIRSKSWPILKSEATSDAFANLKADPALASKSSSARKKKMSTIVERMAPFISFYPATNSTANFRDQEYEARRFESKTTLSMLHVRLL